MPVEAEKFQGHDKGVRSAAVGTRKLDLSCIESVWQMINIMRDRDNDWHSPLLDLYSMLVVGGRFRTLLIVWLSTKRSEEAGN